MSEFVAALPMYDWPETRAQTDAEWAPLRDAFRDAGIDAPEHLTRRNADLPPVPGGIINADGAVIAPDPATLPPEELDIHVLWRHPKLLWAQTCWGPMELGLAPSVKIVGQPDYSAFEGGEGTSYSSVILMRRSDAHGKNEAAPADGRALLPLDLLLNARFAFNGADSMSGIIALTRDLEAAGESLGIFSERVETGGHRASIVAVARGRADICVIDCRSWAMAGLHEPYAADVVAVGWTARRKGLPYIASAFLPERTIGALRAAFDAQMRGSSRRASSG